MPASLVKGRNHAVACGDSARDPRNDSWILIAGADEDRTPDLRGPDDWWPKRQLPSKASRLGHTVRGHGGSLLIIKPLQERIISEWRHWV